jgi:hypothetical protein
MEDNILSLFASLGFVGAMYALENAMNPTNTKENFQNGPSGTQMAMPQTYPGPQNSFVVPQGYQGYVNPLTGSDQILAWQLYQQSINASTPTQDQLNSISGESQMQTGNNSPLRGGVSTDYAPYAMLSNTAAGQGLYSTEYQAVNYNNPRAQAISACSQNQPQFISTSLLPKPATAGQNWDELSVPQDILANQNFLAPTQLVGTDTVSSSNKNPSYDLRPTIPNPMGSAPLIYQSSIMPDLERKNIFDTGVQGGLYGSGRYGNYIGMDSSNYQ